MAAVVLSNLAGPVSAATQAQINQAIQDGLAWLNDDANLPTIPTAANPWTRPGDPATRVLVPDPYTDARDGSVNYSKGQPTEHYVKNAIGRGSIRNIEKYPVYDVTVSFFQEGFMDSPTRIAVISEIKPGESAEFDITERRVVISLSVSERIFDDLVRLRDRMVAGAMRAGDELERRVSKAAPDSPRVLRGKVVLDGRPQKDDPVP